MVRTLLTTTRKWAIFGLKQLSGVFFDKKETDKDWANKRNWICNDQSCPNPYTHACGDPCKLTMEDLFPSRPELLTSEDTKQPEDESEDWPIEWDRENMDRKTN
jgi:hypothetical protein